MGIKSGTLRRKFDEAMNKKTLCKNALLLTIVYYHKRNDNIIKRDKLVSVLLKYDREGKQDIIDTIKSITDEYIPSYIQADRFYQFVVNKEYQLYISNFIPDKLLKFKTDSDQSQKKKYFSARELKQYIYSNNLVSVILENIGCRNIHKSNNNHYIRCSNADGDNSTAITVFIDNPLLNVINETRNINDGNTGDIISLVSYTKELNYFDTIKYLHSILGLYDLDISKLNYENIETDNTEIEREQEGKRKAEYIKALAKDIRLYNSGRQSITVDWLKECIVYKGIEKFFDIRISNNNSQVLIPIKNTDGEIVGINKRTTRTAEEIQLIGIPKYQLTSGFNKSNYIYGLYENENSIKEKGYAVIFEGCKSVLQRATMQDNTSLALLGHSISDRQAEILSSLNLNEIVIAFDKDVAKEEVLFYCDKLLNHGVKKVSYIYDEWSILNEKDSPADAGNKDYKYLFNNRFIYNSKDCPENIAQ